MVGILVFIAATVLIKPLNESITDVRNETKLNCSNPDISTVDNVTCNVLDMGFFYFISVCIAVGLAIMTGKRTITGVFTAIFVFVFVVLLITPLKDFIILARDSAHLNCAVTTITVGARMLCIVVDLWLFLFVVIAISTAITYIFLKKVTPK